jgi:hypothetical protein
MNDHAKLIIDGCHEVLIDLEDVELVSQYTWRVTSKGYIQAKTNIWLHRILMNLKGAKLDPVFVDHINHQKKDNRKANLRVVSTKVNNQNFPDQNRKFYYFNKSRNCYQATVGDNSFGRFYDEKDAANAGFIAHCYTCSGKSKDYIQDQIRGMTFLSRVEKRTRKDDTNISLKNNRYVVRVTVNKKRIQLGSFKTLDEAKVVLQDFSGVSNGII